MPSWLTALLQWVGKFSPRYAAMAAFLAGVLLFASDKTLKYFALDTLAHTHRGVVALIFGASVFLLVSYPVSMAGQWIGGKIKDFRYRRTMRRQLENLGSDQVALLLEFVKSGKNTIIIPFQKSAIAQDLVERGILYRPAQIGGMDGVGYSVMPEAAPFLRYNTFQKIVLKGVKKRQ